MALSNQKILEEMKKGDIIIHPFKKENLATSSYDLTLGEFFFREQSTKYNHSIYNILCLLSRFIFEEIENHH